MQNLVNICLILSTPIMACFQVSALQREPEDSTKDVFTRQKEYVEQHSSFWKDILHSQTPSYLKGRRVLKILARTGDQRTYRYNFKFQYDGQKLEIEPLQEDTVVNVDNNGKISIISKQTVVSKIGNNQGIYTEIPQLGYTNTINYSLTPTGQIENIKIAQYGQPVCQIAHVLAPRFLPDKGVEVGSTWFAKSNPISEHTYQGGTSRFNIVKIEKIGPINTMKLEWEYEDDSKERGSAKGYMWIDPIDGSLVKLEGQINNIPILLGAPPIKNIIVTVTRENKS